MKKTFFGALASVLLLTACDSSSKTPTQDTTLESATQQELQAAVADRDSLLSLVNGISECMDIIKQKENILNSSANGETRVDRAQIQADIASIQQVLEQRRQQLEDLEAKLKKSNLNNSQLQKTIETLRAQIDSQNAEIENLRKSLDTANATIGDLNTTVASLNTTVDSVTVERNEARTQATEAENQLNTCFYVAASSKELKEHDILKTGFLRKKKILEGDFDKSFFTKADKRTLAYINLHSKKAKVLSNQPIGSYEIVDQNGQKVLRILDAGQFWSLSNFLVVQID